MGFHLANSSSDLKTTALQASLECSMVWSPSGTSSHPLLTFHRLCNVLIWLLNIRSGFGLSRDFIVGNESNHPAPVGQLCEDGLAGGKDHGALRIVGFLGRLAGAIHRDPVAGVTGKVVVLGMLVGRRGSHPEGSDPQGRCQKQSLHRFMSCQTCSNLLRLPCREALWQMSSQV